MADTRLLFKDLKVGQRFYSNILSMRNVECYKLDDSRLEFLSPKNGWIKLRTGTEDECFLKPQVRKSFTPPPLPKV